MSEFQRVDLVDPFPSIGLVHGPPLPKFAGPPGSPVLHYVLYHEPHGYLNAAEHDDQFEFGHGHLG